MKVSDFFNDKQTDVLGWKKAVHDHDSIDTIIKSAHEVSELLANEEYKNHFKTLSQDAVRSLKESTAKQLGHFREDAPPGVSAIPLSHYKTTVHDNADAKKAFEESFIKSKASYLETLGHSGFSKIDLSELDEDNRQRMVLTLADLVSQYHGKVDDQDLRGMLQSTLYNKNADDLELGTLHKITEQYMTQTVEKMPQAIISSALSRANSKHNSFDDYEKKVSSFKSAIEKLGLPIQDAPDSAYGLTNISEVFQMHGAHKNDVLNKKNIENTQFSDHLKPMYNDKAA